jgi:hypothetical protein
MNKSFLDLMYANRGEILQQIQKLHEQHEAPVRRCCEDMSSYDPVRDKIVIKESELSRLDSIIQAYINTHR